MNIQKYTEKAQEAVVGAQSMADREGHPEITPEHLLLSLVEQQGGIVPEILRKMNVEPGAIANGLRAETAKNPRAHGGSQPALSARLRQVTSAAEAEAQRLKDEFVSTEHLLLALAVESRPYRAIRADSAAGGRHEGRDPAGAHLDPRIAARHLAEP